MVRKRNGTTKNDNFANENKVIQIKPRQRKERREEGGIYGTRMYIIFIIKGARTLRTSSVQP